MKIETYRLGVLPVRFKACEPIMKINYNLHEDTDPATITIEHWSEEPPAGFDLLRLPMPRREPARPGPLKAWSDTSLVAVALGCLVSATGLLVWLVANW